MNQEIASLIEKYATVYDAFEKLQGQQGLLPGGDQKTGVIAEYYARCYIKWKFKTDAVYAKSGERYDLSYLSNGTEVRVQVKAVSAYSKTRIIAPLNLEKDNSKAPFKFLYLISLDRAFRPDGFYIMEYKEVLKLTGGKMKLQGTIMQGVTNYGKIKQGSKYYDFSQNRCEDLLRSI